MDTRQREFRVGIMVLAALIGLVVLMVFFGKQSIVNLGGEYTIKVRFQRTPGISRNSPVFKNGVKIGRVSGVQLVDQDREVEVSILILNARKLYTNEECHIRQTVIMGEASLEFVKKQNFTGKIEEIDPDKPLVGGIPSDLMSGFTGIEGNLTKAINNVSDAAAQFSEIATRTGDFLDRVNTFIGNPQELQSRRTLIEDTFNDMRTTMKSMNQFADGANNFIGDPIIQKNVRKIIADFPELTERSRSLIDESALFVKDARSLVARGNVSMDKIVAGIEKAELALAAVSKVTDSIKDDVPEFMAALKKSAVKLESLFGEITMLAEGFRNADGTVKRLMRDPAVYEKLSATLDNIEQITEEVNMMLRTDVKPITNNVKILTDKAARDPSIFIRNLVRKQPQTKGALPIWGDGLGSDTLNYESGLTGFIHGGQHINETEIPSIDETIIDEEPINAPVSIIETESKYMKPARLTLGQRISSFLPVTLPSIRSKKNISEPIPYLEPYRETELEPELLPPMPISSQLLPPLQIIQEEDLILVGSRSPQRLRSQQIVQEEDLILVGSRSPQRLRSQQIVQEEDLIPEEGRIVQIDPRYWNENKSSIRQTSY